jgi:hypothetical protein
MMWEFLQEASDRSISSCICTTHSDYFFDKPSTTFKHKKRQPATERVQVWVQVAVRAVDAGSSMLSAACSTFVAFVSVDSSGAKRARLHTNSTGVFAPTFFFPFCLVVPRHPQSLPRW